MKMKRKGIAVHRMVESPVVLSSQSPVEELEEAAQQDPPVTVNNNMRPELVMDWGIYVPCG